LGREPIWEFQIRVRGKRLRVIAPANGYVANLAYLHPTPAPYAAMAPLLIMEAIRQGVVRRCVFDQRGIQPLDSLSIHLHRNLHGTQQRSVVLYEYLEHQPPLPEAVAEATAKEAHILDANPNASIIMQREPGWWDEFTELPADYFIRSHL
jgi:hypothetical protein